MKSYSKSEVDELINKVEKEFQIFSNNVLKEYSDYLQSIKDKNINLIVHIAVDKKEELSIQLHKFVKDRYPKTDGIFTNGVFEYSVETMIHSHLMINHVIPTDKKLCTLYREYLKNLRDNNP